MPKTGRVRMVALIGVLSIALALLTACSGISQADLDAAKQQVAAKQQEVTTVQQKLTAKEKEFDDLKKSAGKLEGVTPLVYTKVGPTPTPPAAPTPRPPGFVAPTPVPPDAATVNAVFPFTFYVETLTGHQVSEKIQYPSCVANAQFRRGTHLVWRFEVFDTSTAKRLTSLDTPSVKLVLAHGEELTARFARKGGTGPWTWVTAWDVPANYPFGALGYQIVVKSKDGRTGTFDPNLVALVNKDRGIDQRLQIVE